MVGLKLDFTPAQPSRLRHVSGPRSPPSPLEFPAKRLRHTSPTRNFNSTSASSSSTRSRDAPPSPYKWMWYCHQCHTGYQIGVTRRCLIDDHVLCYGQPTKTKSKKGKKVRACQSEFDYAGWQNWSAWRRAQTGQESSAAERDCSMNCDWPSQCRWAPKQQEQQDGHNCAEAVSETIPQGQEMLVAPTSGTATQKGKSNDDVLAKISTATQKLASHWASMLAPIEEEPSPTSIDDFLRLADVEAADPTLASDAMDIDTDDDSLFLNAVSVEPLEVAEITSETASMEVDSAVDLGFDFGFHERMEEDAPPSVAEGLNDMAASTLGIALSVPATTTKEIESVSCRRCVSESPTLNVWLQEHSKGASARRMSASSA
ncbi:MAG: hypothetical protein Q9201_006940 [Fulgogasparrea decipioides]